MVKTGKGDKENKAGQETGKKERNSKSSKMRKLNEKIRYATELFDEKPNVEKFLKNVTFDENLESYFKERISIDAEDSGIDLEVDENLDETIIPNDLNNESNFRKCFPGAASKRMVECNETNKRKKRKIV